MRPTSTPSFTLGVMMSTPFARGRATRLALCVLVATGCAKGPTEEPQVLRIAAGEFVLRTDTQPPGDGAGWEPVSLPDTWRGNPARTGDAGWYRFELPGPLDPAGRFAVWLPDANMTAAVWANGRRLGGFDGSHGRTPNDFNRPLLFEVDGAQLGRARNLIEIRLATHSHHFGQLAPIEFGPAALLAERHTRAHLYQIDLPRVATLLVLVASLFAAALWFATRFDPLYGVYSLTAAFCAITSFNYWLQDLPVDRWLWERIIQTSLVWFTLGLPFWVHRRFGLKRVGVERGLLAFGVLVALVCATLPVPRFYELVNWLHVGSLIAASYTVLTVFRHVAQLDRLERVFYTVGGVLGVGFGAHDFAIQVGWLGLDRPYLISFQMPLVVAAFAASLIVRFVAGIDQVAQLNVDLERRVAEKADELERNYERVGQLERDRVLHEERARIMREMHDGLGGQLVSALAMVEGSDQKEPAVAASLRTALSDMRTVIDSLDPRVADIATVLGLLRTRIAPLLAAREVAIRWRVGDLPARSHLGPEQHLHLLRILQEAFTNAVQHARASEIELRTKLDAQQLVILVRDDGCGFTGTADGSGRGLANMRRRAEALGAGLAIEPAEPGTRVVLTLPLQS